MLEEARNRACSWPFGFALQVIPAGFTGMDSEQRVDSGDERIVEPVCDGAVNRLMVFATGLRSDPQQRHQGRQFVTTPDQFLDQHVADVGQFDLRLR
jgi:hypothetical protein